MSAALAVLPMVWACEAKPTLVDTAPQPHPTTKATVEPNLAFYRKYTEAMLRRYMRAAMECGRVPSVLGQEMFRSKASGYTVRNFEDAVIFVHDVEKCLAKLSRMQQVLLARIVLQQYTREETADLLGVDRRTVFRRYEVAIDRMTGIFLEVKLLDPKKACQEGGARR